MSTATAAAAAAAAQSPAASSSAPTTSAAATSSASGGTAKTTMSAADFTTPNRSVLTTMTGDGGGGGTSSFGGGGGGGSLLQKTIPTTVTPQDAALSSKKRAVAAAAAAAEAEKLHESSSSLMSQQQKNQTGSGPLASGGGRPAPPTIAKGDVTYQPLAVAPPAASTVVADTNYNKGGSGGKSSSSSNKKGKSSSSSSSSKGGGDARAAASANKKNNVTFSPVPPPRHSAESLSAAGSEIRTPVRSPYHSHVAVGNSRTGLPTLDASDIHSPSKFLLSMSPTTPSTPKRGGRHGNGDDDDDDDDDMMITGDESEAAAALANAIGRTPFTPKSPRTPRFNDRMISTPTEFGFDFGGKSSAIGGGDAAFDSSNVLAWLHSPNSNGLFSPGGLGSMLNTPKGGGGGGVSSGLTRTPRTPTVSTSFFFSDVASLPLGGGDESPNANNNNNGGITKRGTGRGNICISPVLQGARGGGGQKGGSNSGGGAVGTSTPQPSSLQSPARINFKEIFASPAERSGLSLFKSPPPKTGVRPRNSSSASKGVAKGADLDAVHLAERDLMEDEDLNLLLKLASNTPRPTPGSAAAARPVAVSSSELSSTDPTKGSKDGKAKKGEENLPTLQLPTIGGKSKEKGAVSTGTTKLMRKTSSRDHGDVPEEPRPSVSTSSGEITKPLSLGNRIDVNISDKIKRPPMTSGMITTTHPYAMPPHYRREGPFYPAMHPGISHGGSMRVVVGGPPPPKGGTPPPHMRGPYGGEYQPPYPPHPSHYAHHHGHPHMHYPHYPPPPPHHGVSRQLYTSAPKAKTKTQKVNLPDAAPSSAASKQGSKRPSPVQSSSTATGTPTAKKAKKSKGPPKKKNRSPQLSDGAERQQAAAKIHSVNAASGGQNDKAAALAAAILRGVTMRPSGKWQAQLYFAGKSRYIGVFDSREKAALAYEIAREKLKAEKSSDGTPLSPKATENAVNSARKAAFDGVNEQLSGK
eukprot:CAMPEP_0113522154 /NCGR_PEP_ID=MMETSP0014_2-20120614/45039_1 /TAXON_ID=2857 /ORGANISM="Nitzschia sp." /LENGTH=974 /DNA_ID=CAMNT_0000420195 /DNA_START=487 /DNA_END=3411 /DNA_ORIENTATION=- /assembly_acc=CAM_ASM_000159